MKINLKLLLFFSILIGISMSGCISPSQVNPQKMNNTPQGSQITTQVTPGENQYKVDHENQTLINTPLETQIPLNTPINFKVNGIYRAGDNIVAIAITKNLQEYNAFRAVPVLLVDENNITSSTIQVLKTGEEFTIPRSELEKKYNVTVGEYDEVIFVHFVRVISPSLLGNSTKQ